MLSLVVCCKPSGWCWFYSCDFWLAAYWYFYLCDIFQLWKIAQDWVGVLWIFSMDYWSHV